jgi:hypothetical protein
VYGPNQFALVNKSPASQLAENPRPLRSCLSVQISPE